MNEITRIERLRLLALSFAGACAVAAPLLLAVAITIGLERL